MTRNILALSTALSILAFAPAAFAQTAKLDCTQQVNKSDPSCMTQQNNQTQGQTGATTTTTTTDQNAQSTTATQSNTTMVDLIVPADRLNNAQVMSANDYIGKTVYDQAGNNFGDVNDLIISNDGQIQAVILGVGGFLGIGEKDVAVNTQAIKIMQDGDSRRLVVQTTKEALNSAPTYDRNNRRYADQMNGTSTDQTGSTTTPAANGSNATGNTPAVDCSLATNAADPACVNKTQQ